MQFIDISQYDHEKMQLARPIYDRMRRVLLAAGRTIHPKILDRLIEMGISTLIVEDAESEGITVEEMLDMPTWMDIIAVVQKAYELAEKKQELNLVELQKAVATMIKEVNIRKVIYLIPSSYVTDQLKDYAHSVNVALLSIQMAKKLSYNQLQLRDLALGALLHDIGKVFTKEESEHPKKGFEWIRTKREISLLSAHIAYQHHELLNGKGYPRGLSGDEILEYPQICAVANVYERLISSRETLPHEAMEIIMTKHEVEYKGKIIEAFINSVPSYLPGTKVLLSNDKRAIIVGIKASLHRPVIRYLDNDEEIDLAANPSLIIKEILVK
ncbi:HD-GYP domain-containing protein [Metabacillus bambusae]|uniref:HD domain-containing protein n=1 Tax=Metabacillus bambusae TaxID=2795218 RepID=A0ABS3N760_9BACI|nr:HD domain-containing phosphohydrolase [Metabacillus bambusae]MBO1514003.1 HD domain-containing protein [Metabacillus bambusae]